MDVYWEVALPGGAGEDGELGEAGEGGGPV